jgi:ParB family transcriptional regulator, chromosome partitioning protein
MDATQSRAGSSTHNSRSESLPLEQIKQNPYQPRKRFDDDELSQLRDSITNHGILQPLVVRKMADGFQLIAGERRLRAAKAAGLREVPVHVVDFNEQQVFEAALVENIQRSDLNAIEKATGFKEYLERFKMTQDQLGAKLGLDRTTISNLVNLLNLPSDVQDAVRHGTISLGHAKVLKGVADSKLQSSLCKDIIVKSLSVHALEQQIKLLRQEPATIADTGSKREASAPAEKTAHVTSLENDLRQKFACRVEIKVKAKEKGQIVIGFDNNDDFERIMQVLNG